MELYNISEKTGYITSKALVDIYYKKHFIRVAERVDERLKTEDLRKLEKNRKISKF